MLLFLFLWKVILQQCLKAIIQASFDPRAQLKGGIEKTLRATLIEEL
jgi:hypothetical protein